MAIQTITRDELKKELDNKEPIQVVNVLAPEHYNLGSIQGSIKIPLADLDKRYTELDAKSQIVTYCAGPHCDASRRAAEFLEQKGFDVRAYEGGMEQWRAGNLPIDADPSIPADQPSGLSGMQEPAGSRR